MPRRINSSNFPFWGILRRFEGALIDVPDAGKQKTYKRKRPPGCGRPFHGKWFLIRAEMMRKTI